MLDRVAAVAEGRPAQKLIEGIKESAK